MVDGIDEDPHIFDHRDAAFALGCLAEQLLDVKVGGTGIHPAFGDGDESLAAAVLRQAEDGAGMAFGQAVVEDELLLILGQLQQPQFVGKSRLCHTKPLGRLRLRTIPQDHHIPQSLCLLKGVQILALDVFQQTHRRRPLVGKIAEDGRDLLHLCHFAGTEPPLPRYQLVAILGPAHRDGLEQTVFPDALRQPCQFPLIKTRPRLKRRRPDCVHRQQIDLSDGFLAFKHDSHSFSGFSRVFAFVFHIFPGKRGKLAHRTPSVPENGKPCQKFRSAGFSIFYAVLRYFSGLFAIFPPFLG